LHAATFALRLARRQRRNAPTRWRKGGEFKNVAYKGACACLSSEIVAPLEKKTSCLQWPRHARAHLKSNEFLSDAFGCRSAEKNVR
jgi:hypothetical protein